MRLTKSRIAGAALLIVSAFSLAACGGSTGGAASAPAGTGSTAAQSASGTVTVFAAASLTDAFKELSGKFQQQNPGANVRFSFGGSSTLLSQIQQGAPVDVFASADEDKMNTAVKNGLAQNPKDFVKNRVVVIVPKNNPAGIQQLQDVAKPGVKLVLAQDGVPVAEYTKKILKKADAEYGAGFDQKVMNNIVSREADVRASANRVALGEADATFVYSSDVTPDIRNRVKVIDIPNNLNVVATYPIAVLNKAPNPQLAQKWVDLVLSNEGQQVLQKWGFQPVK